MTVAFQNGSFLSGAAGVSTMTQSGGVTSASLYNENYLDKKYSYTDSKESYEIAYSGRDAALNTKISNIASYLANGEEDKAMAAYEKLLTEMESQTRYGQLVSESGDDSQLKAVARQLIESEIGGDLEEFIRENSRDAAGVHAQQIRTLGNCDSTSKEDLLLAMCDIEEDKSNNILLNAVSTLAMPFETIGNLLFNGNKKVK